MSSIKGPDGVPLQTHYATALRTVAAAVSGNDHVLGYDTFNEPWPGTTWQTCLTGCPKIEQDRLGAFATRMATAIRQVDATHLVFTEPWVLFNFGQTATSLHGYGAPQSGLSFHVYATTPANDLAAMDHAVAAGAHGDALLASEFGAVDDPATIDRLTGGLDERLLPWMFWSYSERVIKDLTKAPTPSNIQTPVLDALARPYASATNGTPTSYAYDPTTHAWTYTYATGAPGRRATSGLTSVLVLPTAAYPDGYRATVSGGTITSAADASELVVQNAAGATTVTVRVTSKTPPPTTVPATTTTTLPSAGAATPVDGTSTFTG